MNRSLLLLIPLFLTICTPLIKGVTHEVVQIFQPLSLHETDGAGHLEEAAEAMQADVMPRPYVSSGALPEDLIEAIALPHQIPSNSENYKVQEANLIRLCKLSLVAEMKEHTLLITLDLSQFALPDYIDLTSRQILKLTLISIKKTLMHYFDQEEDRQLLCKISIIGTNKNTEALKDLESDFIAGE